MSLDIPETHMFKKTPHGGKKDKFYRNSVKVIVSNVTTCRSKLENANNRGEWI